MTEPILLHPEWPNVRCDQCSHVYMLVPAGFLVTGDCPRCHCVTFNTSMPLPANDSEGAT